MAERYYTYDEVAENKELAIFQDIVINIGEYLEEHPGGHKIIIKNLPNITDVFRSTGHSVAAYRFLSRLKVGKLKSQDA